MDQLSANPAFRAYEATALLLTLNLLALWVGSGAARTRTKTARNPEDAAAFNVPLADEDPPAVARVLRAHANAGAAIYPFLILGLVYVLAGGAPMPATIVFAAFTVGRFGHSLAYLFGKQPWRSIAFTVGVVATVVLMAMIVWTLFHGASCTCSMHG